MAGMGAVIRDSKGKVVAAGINQAQHRGNVSLAEAEAVQWGMQVAREAALSSLIIESNCLEVVELVNNTKGSRTEIHWTISKIQKQRKSFQNVKVKYVPRQCNACTHSLAKLALGRNTRTIWLQTIPVEVSNVMVL